MIISNITRIYGEQGYEFHIEEARVFMQGRQGLYEHIHTYTCTCQAHLHLHLHLYVHPHLHLHFTHALTHIGSLCVCVLCVCVSVCPREDTRIVRPSIYPLKCLYVRLSVWAVFSPLSVGLSACLSMNHSVYTSFSICILNCQSVSVYVFSLCKQEACLFIPGYSRRLLDHVKSIS